MEQTSKLSSNNNNNHPVGESMGRNLKIKWLIDPSLPTPTSLPRHSSSPLFSHFCSIPWLWFFAEHEIPTTITADSLPRTQRCNEIQFKENKWSWKTRKFKIKNLKFKKRKEKDEQSKAKLKFGLLFTIRFVIGAVEEKVVEIGTENG